MHYLREFFDALPSVAGILLATLAFALVFVKELDEKLKDKRGVRWSLAIVLSVIGISGFISDFVQRAEERARVQSADKERRKAEQEQKDAVDGIKEQLHQSELQRVADVKYMQGKLDVFVQFAPAIVRLAQATEENTRKQYEAKMLSSKELYDAAMDIVRRMREFAAKDKLQSLQQMDTQWMSMRAAKTDAERQKLWEEESRASTMRYYQSIIRERLNSEVPFCQTPYMSEMNF